jgi:hypothetical protein
LEFQLRASRSQRAIGGHQAFQLGLTEAEQFGRFGFCDQQRRQLSGHAPTIERLSMADNYAHRRARCNRLLLN